MCDPSYKIHVETNSAPATLKDPVTVKQVEAKTQRGWRAAAEKSVCCLIYVFSPPPEWSS